MTHLLLCALSLVGVLAVSADGFAQTSAPSTGDRDDKARAEWKLPADAAEARQMIGSKVRAGDGKDVGEIDQLVVSTTDGKITHAIVGMGGVAGLGQRKIVVPWSEVKLSRDGNKYVASVPQSALDSAPRYAGRDRTEPAASPATGKSETPPKSGTERKN